MNLDELIKGLILRKLRLYRGERSKETDDLLFRKAMILLTLESVKFIEENQPKLVSGSESLEFKQRLTGLVSQLMTIPNWKQMLTARLNYYLDNWIIGGFEKYAVK
jgi:hypothetical protein